jgi:ABC-type sugar transport system ATPase subunit
VRWCGTTAMVLVSLRDVRFTYAFTERPALDGISLELQPGLLHGVVGMNASGKSTLCDLIRGVIPHFHEGTLEGEVQVLGRSLLDWDPADGTRRTFPRPSDACSTTRSPRSPASKTRSSKRSQ